MGATHSTTSWQASRPARTSDVSYHSKHETLLGLAMLTACILSSIALVKYLLF